MLRDTENRKFRNASDRMKMIRNGIVVNKFSKLKMVYLPQMVVSMGKEFIRFYQWVAEIIAGKRKIQTLIVTSNIRTFIPLLRSTIRSLRVSRRLRIPSIRDIDNSNFNAQMKKINNLIYY